MSTQRLPSAATVRQLRRKYEQELLENVIPFWQRHSPDSTHGGYFNCLDKDGSVYDTTKHVWLQGRQAWMFSKLYTSIDARPEWLALAKSGIDFLRTHGKNPEGRLYFALTRDGRPLQFQRKIFSECFFIIALAAYSRASGESAYLREAKEVFARAWDCVNQPQLLGRPVLEGQPPSQNLAIPMIFLNVLEELTGGDVRDYRTEIDDCILRLRRHVQSEQQIVLENVSPGGDPLPGYEGRLLNPGHAIEAGWFLQHWAQILDRADLSREAMDMVRWSHVRGWDRDYGGLYYFLDCEGHSPVQLEWSMKLWWPHCEGLYAHLLNFSLTKEEKDWALFAELDDYVFRHFPDRSQGEWFGYLDRRGEVTHRFKGGPYKGCFHVPRALWLCHRKLVQLEEQC